MPRLICLSILALLFASVDARATSLDDIYRDIVRSDHDGYLPIFVKNRPERILPIDNVGLPDPPAEKADKKNANVSSETIFFTNQRRARDEKQDTKRQQWERAVNAVRNNTVTPVELEELDNRSQENDPRALELLAWMYANGSGVRQDLVRSFTLYQKCSQIGVPNSAENALLVFRSMTPEQRESLNAFNRQ